MTTIHHLICTVGTSLFFSNLTPLTRALSEGKPLEDLQKTLAEAFSRKDWPSLALTMSRMSPMERTMGAEVNSIQSLLQDGLLDSGAAITLLVSDTEDGRNTGEVLRRYLEGRGFCPVTVDVVEGLQDADPRRFRTQGLRNLARRVCRAVRERGAQTAGINATGGYKAQVAVAVLLGQALGVNVYYRHERFDSIIAFPPLPVALDFGVWMQATGLLQALDRDPQPASRFTECEWDERLEPLVERVTIDGEDYLELSAAGQIFHETFRERFRTAAPSLLPPAAKAKKPPRVEDSGHMAAWRDFQTFLEKLTEEISYVTVCASFYHNIGLPESTRFRLGPQGLELVYSNGSATAKARIETTATTDSERRAALADLNTWLGKNS